MHDTTDPGRRRFLSNSAAIGAMAATGGAFLSVKALAADRVCHQTCNWAG